ncbi:hypothetical protein GCM10009117_10500 [Gangjinia marincola]|uniref:Uncharacterized protein n=1 Tax=Gangjinia marincola TaxID=578463 RepID=A0ABP3XU74_9FLAO
MGFGGSVAAMITSLKNNKRDRKTLFDTKHKSSTSNSKIVNDITSSPEQLAQIRLARKMQQKRLLVKRIIATIIGGVIVTGLIYLLLNGY